MKMNVAVFHFNSTLVRLKAAIPEAVSGLDA